MDFIEESLNVLKKLESFEEDPINWEEKIELSKHVRSNSVINEDVYNNKETIEESSDTPTSNNPLEKDLLESFKNTFNELEEYDGNELR